jgi:hypothetical protein
MIEQLQQKVKEYCGHAKPKSEKTITPKPAITITLSFLPQSIPPVTLSKSQHEDHHSDDDMCTQSL